MRGGAEEEGNHWPVTTLMSCTDTRTSQTHTPICHSRFPNVCLFFEEYVLLFDLKKN